MIPLLGGERVTGKINLVQEEASGWVRVGGELTGPRTGSFSLGRSGSKMGGTILLPQDEIAYAITDQPDGRVLMQEKLVSEVVCFPIPRFEEERGTRARSLGPQESPPLLSSRPGATAVLYLDFDGETVTDPLWNRGNTIVVQPSSLNNTEITEVWNRVKEDYWPFNIDVTTDVTHYNNAPVGRRMRCIITPTCAWYNNCGAGGVAYVSSFAQAGQGGFSSTIPCWVFNPGVVGVAEAASHELGHTLGLLHDGREIPGTGHEEYYAGHGTGAVGWAPIMGVGYYKQVVQWSKGEYLYANNQEDDIAIVANAANGYGFVADEAGDSSGTAATLNVVGSLVNQTGIISATNDVDFYGFTVVTSSVVNISANPAAISPDLDILLELRNDVGTLVASSNPDTALNAAFNYYAAPGTYYIKVQGTGRGAVLGDGYSNYGSISHYSLTGSIGGDFAAPSLSSEPAVTPGTSNTIYWSAVEPVQQSQRMESLPSQAIVMGGGSTATTPGGVSSVLLEVLKESPDTSFGSAPEASVGDFASTSESRAQAVQSALPVEQAMPVHETMPVQQALPIQPAIPVQQPTPVAQAMPVQPAAPVLQATVTARQDLPMTSQAGLSVFSATVPGIELSSAPDVYVPEEPKSVLNGLDGPLAAQSIFSETFESGFPGTSWGLAGSPTWDDTTYSYHSGTRSAWCAASTLPPSGGYVDNMSAWMVYGPFSLADATNASVNFWYKNYSEPGWDYFRWYASTNGANFSGYQVSGNQNTWRNQVFDLTTAPTYGNLCGKSQVWIAFRFSSDGSGSGPTYTGAFVDDIAIEKNLVLTPDLTPYQLANWNDKIPIGTTQLYGTNAHSYSGTYSNNQALYFNWASLNQGSATASNYTVHVEVTGAGGGIWEWTGLTTSAGYYVSPSGDVGVGPLAAGSHTFKVWVDYAGAVAESDEGNNYYERTISVVEAPGTPDLTPYQPANWNDKIPVGTSQLAGTNAHSYSGTYSNNQTLYVNWASANQGSATASNYTVHVEVTGTGGGSWNWTGITTPSGYYISLPSDLPVGPLAAGDHTFKLWVDYTSAVAESSETNNYYERTITVAEAPGAPDLTAYQPANWNDKIPIGTSQLAGTNAHSYSGVYSNNQTLYFNWASLNQGSATASNYTVHVDVTGTGGGSWDWTGITTESGYYINLGNDLAVGPLEAGSHTFKVWVDYAGAVAESDEGNNYYERTISVSAGPSTPDLTPYQPANWNDRIPIGTSQLAGTNAHSYSGTYSNNQTLFFSWSSANQGSATASNYTVHVEVTGTGGGSWDWTSITTPAGYYLNLMNDLPVGPLAAGEHTFKVWVDYAGTVAESDESNNYYERTITVWGARSTPDLTPYQPANWNDRIPIGATQLYNTNAHSYSGSYYSTQMLYFNWASANQGSATASNYTVHVEVTGTGGGTWNWTVATIPAGYYTWLGRDQPVGPLTAGDHTFKVWVDYDGTVGEIDESNNYYERTITVAGAPGTPDLTPYQAGSWNDKIPIGTSQLAGTNAHSYSGSYSSTQTLYFNWASVNQGSATASNYTVHFEVTGTGGGSWDWTNITTAPNYFTFLSSDPPVGPLAAGSHTFKLWVDYNGNVPEADEGNNYYERTINVSSAIPVEYYAECADNPGFWSSANSGWTTGTEFTFGNLTPGQTYWYRVRARQGVLESPWSNVRSSQQESLPAISVTPAGQDFGYILVGSTADRAFYVTNRGGGTLSGSASVPAPFSIGSGDSYSLAANQGQAVTVRYSPTLPGTNTANVTFTGGGGATRSVTGSAYVQPEALQFAVGAACGPHFSQVLVPVQVTRFINISSFQFSLHWNPAAAAFANVEQFGLPGLAGTNFGTALTNSGTLTVSWNDPNASCTNVPDGTTAFAVRFQLLGSPGTTNSVIIDGTPTSMEAANCALVPVPVVPLPAEVCITPPTVTVAGTLSYGSDLAKPVSDVAMSLTGAANLSALTAVDGRYGFTNVPAGGSYCFTPARTNDAPAANGVSTVDISLIRRHILNIAWLDAPAKLLAADLNGSSSVTTVDITYLRRMVLGSTNTFPAGLWRFVPSDHSYPDPLNPWDAPSNRCYTNLSGDLTNENFLAIKLGDVNNSWTPPAGGLPLAAPGVVSQPAAAPGSGPAVVFQVSSHSAQPGQTITAQVTAGGFRQVTSAQFTLAWDPTVLRYLSTGNPGLNGLTAGNFGATLTDSGKLAFSWDDPNATGITVADGTVLFTVSFAVIGNAGTVSPLALVDAPAAREAGVNFAAAPLLAENGQVSVVAVMPPRLIQAAYADGVFQVKVPTAKGKSYILEFSDSLPVTHWTPLPAVSGDGTDITLTDPAATTQQRYYRVRVE